MFCNSKKRRKVLFCYCLLPVQVNSTCLLSVLDNSFVEATTRDIFIFENVILFATDRKGKEMFYLTTHSTHFIYGYMASDIW